MNIQITKIGQMPDGRDVMAYTMVAETKYSVTILNLGGIIQKIVVPDKNGNLIDVVCGFDDSNDYLVSGTYFGALVGRCANRIANGSFSLDGKTYKLCQNNGTNHLHGGKIGFTFRLWDVKASVVEGNGILQFHIFSPDGEENYPGNMDVNVTYVFRPEGTLSIHYVANTDKKTIINMTNHSYFNLDGYGKHGIDGHMLWMDCDKINLVDDGLIPTGDFLEVKNTPYDFQTAKEIGQDFGSTHPHMVQCIGYDTNFCVRDYTGDLRHIATLKGQESGISLKVYTDRPCIQIYTANFVNPDEAHMIGDVAQYRHCAVAMETQAMPDSINHQGFTKVILLPDETYDTTTIFDFSDK